MTLPDKEGQPNRTGPSAKSLGNVKTEGKWLTNQGVVLAFSVLNIPKGGVFKFVGRRNPFVAEGWRLRWGVASCSPGNGPFPNW